MDSIEKIHAKAGCFVMKTAHLYEKIKRILPLCERTLKTFALKKAADDGTIQPAEWEKRKAAKGSFSKV